MADDVVKKALEFLASKDRQDDFDRFVKLALDADFFGMRQMVADGFDIKKERTILQAVVKRIEWDGWSNHEDRYEIVREVLALGADATWVPSCDDEGSSPMFFAALNGDVEMLAILMDAGADPNKEKMDVPSESLYDTADFDYRLYVWDLNIPEEPTPEEQADEDLWVRWLDRLAIKYGKERPFTMMCLRRYGALTMSELVSARAQETHGKKLKYSAFDAPDDFCRFVAHACAADFDGMRRMVEEGFDLSSVCAVPPGAGRTLLQTVIDELGSQDRLRDDVVRECLALGADVRQLNSEGTGALFSAVLNRDAEMLDILLQAGADPNEEGTLASWQTLYDWSVADYRKDVWKYSEPWKPDKPDWDNKDAWLAYIDACAVENGKERPWCALRLRQAGALSFGEAKKMDGD